MMTAKKYLIDHANKLRSLRKLYAGNREMLSGIQEILRYHEEEMLPHYKDGERKDFGDFYIERNKQRLVLRSHLSTNKSK